MKKIIFENIKEVSKMNDNQKNRLDVIVISLPISTSDILNPFNNKFRNKNSVKVIKDILDNSISSLNDEGLLFIYGSPLQLIQCYEVIRDKMTFRHWISIDALDSLENTNTDHLKHNHLGVLMLTRNEKYLIYPENARIPYLGCTACGRNVKDWGGKKHLMNNKGSGISDVWRDFYKVLKIKSDPDNDLINLNIIDSTKLSFKFDESKIGKPILERILSLVDKNKSSIALYNISKDLLPPINTPTSNSENTMSYEFNCDEIKNKVLLGDCIEQMEKLCNRYPDGIFDLVFADPPYNLNKNYKVYDDTLAKKEYLEWCNKWLELCVKLTKPSGSIFVLNIPKWSVEHAITLNKIAYFQNWIVWDSLSTPKGKMMPAHYSLLYYTKSPNNFVFNFPGYIDSPEYCLRSSCMQTRKKIKMAALLPDYQANFTRTSPISDIWSDVHRIKHKKNRDDHPCQLPDKLMDRIINVFSENNSLIFDPFAGAGTTAIRAIMNNRNYTTIELDNYYKEIIEKKLEEIKNHGDVKRKKTEKKKKSIYTKKDLEIKSQKLAAELGRKPYLDEFINTYMLDVSEIELLYDDPKSVLKAGRIGLLNNR